MPLESKLGEMNPRVLVVDDAPDFRALVRKFITIEWPQAQVTEYDPIALGRPEAAFDWTRFDVVLLDYMIGPEDGLAWLRDLRAVPGVPPIIFMTGAGSESVAARSIKLGASEYLSKYDLSRRKLADAIAEVVAESSAAAARLQAARAAAGPGFEVPAGPSGTDHIAISGYEMVSLLGQGGMAVVYLARHLASGEQRVLKILDTRASADKVFLDRFIQEYGVVSRIASPHVIRIYDQGMTDNHAYIAMEYIAGDTLKERIVAGGLAPEAAMHVFRQLLAALKAVHAAGIVHRDLKPHNIMFRADGTLVLLDFGVAKLMGSELQLTRVDTIIGTPLYMSPEQTLGAPIDYRSDLYSAGVILFEMLTGNLPYRAETLEGLVNLHRHAPLPQLPAPLRDYQVLVSRLMAKRPEERFQSAAELLPEGYS